MVVDDQFFEAASRSGSIKILCLRRIRGYEKLSDAAFSALLKCRSLKVFDLGNISCTDEQYDMLETKFGESSIMAGRDEFCRKQLSF